MGTCYPYTSKVGLFQTSENQRVVIWGLKRDQDSLFREEICKRQKISLYQPLAVFILHKDENGDWCWRTTNPQVYWATARAAWKVSTETTENGLFQLNKLGFDDEAVLMKKQDWEWSIIKTINIPACQFIHKGSSGSLLPAQFLIFSTDFSPIRFNHPCWNCPSTPRKAEKKDKRNIQTYIFFSR